MKPEWFGPVTAHAKEWTDVYLGDALLRSCLLLIALLGIAMELEALRNLWRREYPRFDYAPYTKRDDVVGVLIACFVATVAAAALWRLS